MFIVLEIWRCSSIFPTALLIEPGAFFRRTVFKAFKKKFGDVSLDPGWLTAGIIRVTSQHCRCEVGICAHTCIHILGWTNHSLTWTKVLYIIMAQACPCKFPTSGLWVCCTVCIYVNAHTYTQREIYIHTCRNGSLFLDPLQLFFPLFFYPFKTQLHLRSMKFWFSNRKPSEYVLAAPCPCQF